MFWSNAVPLTLKGLALIFEIICRVLFLSILTIEGEKVYLLNDMSDGGTNIFISSKALSW